MVSVVIVGIDGWEEWTKPALMSVKDDLNIVVVDNGSKTPYPKDKTTRRIDKTVSYTKAINYGVQCVGVSDWYLVLNNDILFNAPVLPVIKQLDDSFLYGRQIIEGHGYRWLGLWLALIPHNVWREDKRRKIGRMPALNSRRMRAPSPLFYIAQVRCHNAGK